VKWWILYALFTTAHCLLLTAHINFFFKNLYVFLCLVWHHSSLLRAVKSNFYLIKMNVMKRDLLNLKIMKKIIPVLSIIAIIAIVMVSCKSNTGTNSDNAKAMNYSDTAGLAQFQQWKVQNELAKLNEYNQYAMSTRTAAAPRTTKRSTAKSETWSKTSESSNAAKAPVKKGLSKAAKGAAIGAAGGAIAGAVINKRNRVVGAVIGGVVGGGVGYGIGRHMDKKDGRLVFN
jgi:YmgG-like glycine-zipper protein